MNLCNGDLSNVHGTRIQRLKREDGALDCEGPYLLCQSLVASCRTRGDLERLKPGNEMIRSVF